MPPRQAPETHPFFGTLFRVPKTYTFWRNATSSRESGSNALKSAAEIEPFTDLIQASPSEEFRRLCGQASAVSIELAPRVLTLQREITLSAVDARYTRSPGPQIDRRIGKISAVTTTVWPSASRPA